MRLHSKSYARARPPQNGPRPRTAMVERQRTKQPTNKDWLYPLSTETPTTNLEIFFEDI